MSPDAPQQSNPRREPSWPQPLRRGRQSAAGGPGRESRRNGGLAHLTGRAGNRVRTGDAETPRRLGWLHGAPDESLEPFTHNGLELVPVPVSAAEIEELRGFSNATLWPLVPRRHSGTGVHGSGGTPTFE